MLDISGFLCWVFLLISSGIFYKSYDLLDYNLSKYVTKYNKFDNNRKEYILTNMLKSFFLGMISLVFLYNVFFNYINLFEPRNWASNIIFWKNLVAVYTSTDLIGLIRNKKMATTTVIHHYCVLVGFAVISFKDFTDEGIYKSIFVYGCFSSLAFLVNFYLGARFLIDKESIINFLIKKLSYVSYALVVILNILWQLFYLITVLFYETSLFKIIILSTLVGLWLRDDIILLKFLSN